ncbi:MAG: hypothetical protein ETSY1_13625 [Candidatus Entotheonella factor]|uniref:Uncharacterized protein n=1 Tax=Entotheonella factor TaxID=1429438 RepID=W4LPN6_ENTF1|nr:MAG: hypothetical protein ETSY1_13625 [Candidatus Entotheonella factor]
MLFGRMIDKVADRVAWHRRLMAMPSVEELI